MITRSKHVVRDSTRYLGTRRRCIGTTRNSYKTGSGSFLHIPLNFGAVMRRNVQRIEAAEPAKLDEMIVLSDENSLWGADVYIAVSKDVPGARMATLSGDFLSKVFEGPYKDVPKWMRR